MNFIQSLGSPSKILAASIRSAADAKAMAGCDYILCNERVLKELNNGNAEWRSGKQRREQRQAWFDGRG